MKQSQRTKKTVVPQQTDNNDYILDTDESDDIWPSRMPTSTRRYRGDVKFETGRTGYIPADVQAYPNSRSTIPPRRTATQAELPAMQQRSADVGNDPPRRSSTRKSGHWLMFLGLALLVMLMGWMILSMLLHWWQVTQDDWHYGRPRTFQTDIAVGHNDSSAHPSHFIALNLDRHVQIIECPSGDCAKAKVWIGPTLIGDGQDLAVVTLTFKDVNNDGKLDMIVNVQDSRFVFINEDGTFRPARSGENVVSQSVSMDLLDRKLLQ